MNEQMKRALALGRMDRRSFMAAALGAGFTLSAASLMASEALASEPKQGGTLRVGFQQGATSDSMDPATFNNDFMFALGYAVFNSLIELGPDGSARPDLVEHFEATPDAKVWTFRLFDGVKFSDGKPLTSRDVIATLNHHMGENSKSGVKPLLTQIAEMKADGDTTVVFTLSEGNADFPYIFNDYHLGIRPAQADGTIDPMTMIGSGGYTVESFEPGVRAVLKRRGDYWKPNRAFIDTVEIIAIADATARMNALITGEVDLIDRPDLKTIHLLKRNKDIKIHTQDGTMHYVLPMFSDVAPFTDNNVRMALKYAIDREEIVSKVLKGYGSVGNDQPIAPSMPFYKADLPQRAYDADKAKYYLKQSGLTSLDVGLHTADASFNGAVDASVLFSESAKAAGINIVRKALQAPARQIASNAGAEASIIIGKILENKSATYGYNAAKDEYGDMIALGIVDPVKVVRTALQDAASVAGLLVTTEAMIADAPKKDSPMPAMPGGGMGGMGGMDF